MSTPHIWGDEPLTEYDPEDYGDVTDERYAELDTRTNPCPNCEEGELEPLVFLPGMRCDFCHHVEQY